MTNDVTKRVRYFNGQFLKSEDFIDEQSYHIDRQRHPYKFLHVSGICNGLTVAKDNKPKQVTVAPGTALDALGRLIVLDQLQTVDIPNKGNRPVNIYISFHEKASDLTQPGNAQSRDEAIGVKGATRWCEKPNIELLEGNNIPNYGILLATVTLDQDGNVTDNINMDNRQYSGVRLPSGDGTELVLRSRGNGGGALLTGSLSIQGDLSVNGKVGIGTTSPTAKLEVSGSLKLQSGVAVNEFSTDVNLGTSDSAVPTQKAVKTYADKTKANQQGDSNVDFSVKKLTVATLKLGGGAEVSAFSTDVHLGTSDSAVPTQNAVRIYADTKADKTGSKDMDFEVKKLKVVVELVMGEKYRIGVENNELLFKNSENQTMMGLIYLSHNYYRKETPDQTPEIELKWTEWKTACQQQSKDPHTVENFQVLSGRGGYFYRREIRQRQKAEVFFGND